VNTRLLKVAGIAFSILWAAQSATFAQGTVTGKIFADWYDNQSNLSTLDNTAARSGFDLTRAYFGYNYTIDSNFGAGVMLDVARINPATAVTTTTTTTGTVNDSSISSTHDTVKSTSTSTSTVTTDKRYDAFLKFAYLTWKNALPYTTLTAGQIPYFAFDVQEAFWDHRYIYKTLMDQEGWESSADLGVKAVFSPDPMLKVTLGVTDGEGYSAPQDAYGDFKGALGIQVNPIKELTVYLYGDFMQVGNGTAPAAHATQSTGSLFAGYNLPDVWKLGAEFDAQNNKGGVLNHTVSGVSVNGSVNIIKPLQIFGRFDMIGSAGNWNENSSNNQTASYDGRIAIGGIQYQPVKKVKLAADYQWTLDRASAKVADPTAGDVFYINAEVDY